MTEPDEAAQVITDTRLLTDRMLATVALLERFTKELNDETRPRQEEDPGD